MRILTYLVLITIILLGITFAVLNHELVSINYYVGQRSLPLSLLLVIVFALGCLLALLISSGILFKLKIKNYHLKQQLKISEKEVENLRAIPIQDKH